MRARARNRRDIRSRVFTIHFFTHFIAGTRGGFNLRGIFPQRIDKINGGARARARTSPLTLMKSRIPDLIGRRSRDGAWSEQSKNEEDPRFN